MVAGSREPRRQAVRLASLAGGCAALVVLWGGYDRHWRWTGFGRAELWDWLHIFVLPLAVVAAPLWVRHRDRLDRRHRVAVVAPLVAFVALVAAGYAFDLGWTGFPGNELWDWLELLLLPLAVGLIPVWIDVAKDVQPRHVAAATAGAVFLVVAVVGGYAGHWHWTGFRGNTLFDWLQLFVAPLLVPIVVVPIVEATMTPAEPEADPAAHARPAAAATEA